MKLFNDLIPINLECMNKQHKRTIAKRKWAQFLLGVKKIQEYSGTTTGRKSFPSTKELAYLWFKSKEGTLLHMWNYWSLRDFFESR